MLDFTKIKSILKEKFKEDPELWNDPLGRIHVLHLGDLSDIADTLSVPREDAMQVLLDKITEINTQPGSLDGLFVIERESLSHQYPEYSLWFEYGDTGVLKEQIEARQILADTPDVPEPLFREAEVDFEYDVLQNIGLPAEFLINADSVELELPKVKIEDAKALPDSFSLSLLADIEDVFGRAGTVNFDFQIELLGFEELPDGMARLDYNYTLEGLPNVNPSEV